MNRMNGQPTKRHINIHKKHNDYMDPRTSAFGKMGFPQIHITADFRRLLGDNVKSRDENKQIVMEKCVLMQQREICAAYNLMDKSIILKFVVPGGEEKRLSDYMIDKKKTK